ncbi:MAG: family 20 glycosylhydrolase [Clostridia bacterium]|nr:family 20 glycosylhydrolase [Clostridia bacterium]
MNFNPNFKDTYVDLSGEPVLLDAGTVIESQNAVIRKMLLPLLDGEKVGAVASIRFLPFGAIAREKVIATFGAVLAEAEDSYLLEVTEQFIAVYSNNVRGHLYGACTLLSHYRDGIGTGYIYNVPCVPFRAVKMYLPAEEKLDEFYYMLDMFMHFGYNAVVLEVGGAMEYKKHPEINDFWVEHCRIFSEYSHYADNLQHSQPWGKNSIHIENGGGEYLSQATVRAICEYARSRGLEPIPEVPSLSHADYLLAGRTDFAERPEDPYPDTYCPSNPKSYEILFDVIDEVIDVFAPKVMHIGHDEFYVYGVCEKCRGKRGADLFAADITKIHDYLAERGIRTMMWSEKLINSHTRDFRPIGGAYYTTRYVESDIPVVFKGKEYKVQYGKNLLFDEAALLPKDAIRAEVEETYPAISKIPSDVICMNWYWSLYPQGEREFHYHGLPLVYGNFEGMLFKNFRGRIASGAKGVCVSSWGASDFKQMQRGKRIADVIYASRMAWSRSYDDTKRGKELSGCAAAVFDYRFRDALAGSHIDILHTTDLEIPHGYFGCGDFLDDGMFRLGCYHIYYKDGTDEKVDIIWGENVGPAMHKTEGKEYPFDDAGTVDLSYCKETVFTCDFVDKGDGRYYRFVIPTKKPVERVKPEILSKYEDNLVISSITVKN